MSEIERLMREMEAEINVLRSREAEQERLRKSQFDDAMIAHRWFAKHFGPTYDGRDFAIKCEMADAHLAALRAVAERVVEIFEPMQQKGQNGHTFELLLKRAKAALSQLAQEQQK